LTDLIERTLRRLGERLTEAVSRPGDGRYAAAAAIYVKLVRPMPRAIAHCLTTEDVQSAIRAARDLASRSQCVKAVMIWPAELCASTRLRLKLDPSEVQQGCNLQA
jgi:hypothetical protein